jgi:Zn-dependent oligopeptidase
LPEIETNTIALLSYVSPDEKVRKVTAKIILELSKKQLDVMQDKELFRAFNEYKPKKLAEDQTRLYKDLKRSFESMGFHLPSSKEKELVQIKKEITKLEQEASLAINNARDTILCTREELDGLDEAFINRLSKDKKTGKIVVKINPIWYRPAEVELLHGDPSKANKELGWKANVMSDKLAEIMVKSDINNLTK